MRGFGRTEPDQPGLALRTAAAGEIRRDIGMQRPAFSRGHDVNEICHPALIITPRRR
jgi:hypothetical protein